jgi:hypothetical protein
MKDDKLDGFRMMVASTVRGDAMSDGLQKVQEIILYGIDPGSSKPWVGYVGRFDPEKQVVIGYSKRSWNIADLDSLISEIAGSSSKPVCVLLSLDAPINRPALFNPPGIVFEGKESGYPFNVNSFTTRPCEKALTSKPSLRLQSLQHQGIMRSIAAICEWEGDHRRPENKSLTAIHSGVNVRGYMGAPHGPVVDLFRTRLAEALRSCGSCLSMSPREAMNPLPDHVYLLESHPAVAMAVLASSGHLGKIRKILQYKGANKPDVQAFFTLLRDEIVRYSVRFLGQIDSRPEDDDDLDALVGFLNVVELLERQGDWFGRIDSGYFLIPKVHGINVGVTWEAVTGDRNGETG